MTLPRSIPTLHCIPTLHPPSQCSTSLASHFFPPPPKKKQPLLQQSLPGCVATTATVSLNYLTLTSAYTNTDNRNIIYFTALMRMPKKNGKLCFVDQTLTIKAEGEYTFKPPNGCYNAEKRLAEYAEVYFNHSEYVNNVGERCHGNAFLTSWGWKIPENITTLSNATATWTGTFKSSGELA